MKHATKQLADKRLTTEWLAQATALVAMLVIASFVFYVR
jgi:hypothetical protein